MTLFVKSVNLAKKIMTKEEFLELAADKWDEIEKQKASSDSFYDYEKGFDELWVEFGRRSLEGSLGELSKDRRKKKET